MNRSVFASHPQPAQDYKEAAERINALQARDGLEVNPVARSTFLTHEQRVEHALLLFHGYTNSPKGFQALGKMFHEIGFNVLIPREPHHGLNDRMTTAQEKVTAAGLVRFAEEAVDMVQGLGERVTVAGISMGGVLAAWVAQNRADIALAAPISPAFAFQALPRRLAPLGSQLFRWLPNRYMWWDPEVQDIPHPPYHCYPRYATRALAHILHLGQMVLGQARRSPPCAREILVITNPTDESVDNRGAAKMVEAWRRVGGTQVRTYEFEQKHKLIHDLIDPEQPKGKIEIVYPILLDLLMH
jgi:carboxylesterase